MIRTEEDLQLDGRRLRRFIFRPDPGSPIRAAAMHFHGQGDFSERYDETLSVFTEQGVVCVSTDFPGHGRSEGKRGCVPGFDFMALLAESNETRCRELCPAERGPLGILGHSAGGLVALHELLRRPEPYAFSWISSPLVRPDANQHPLLVKIAPLIARILPNLTVGTGVTEESCIHGEPDSDAAAEWAENPECFHAKVSVSWGHAMMIAAEQVRAGLVSDPPTIPLLLTQGLADPVCPPECLREVIERADLPRLTYREFPDLLHEPFADSGKDDVFAALSAWLAEVLAEAEAPAAVQTSPSG